eukprot:TRINITY_DN35979_c0_g1_i1.p1 TRINITY_DN35979_c0_g1~~TRINITY_DN35979_c0_g1_i1.p1  ORF type:complete len:101 (+),score=8.59 TRINITY_DN35979_c0_g1_i1:177-479(+)
MAIPSCWPSVMLPLRDVLDHNSSVGHILIASGRPISWQTRKHNSVSRSTVEAQYVECSIMAAEAVFIQLFFAVLRGNLDLTEAGKIHFSFIFTYDQVLTF